MGPLRILPDIPDPYMDIAFLQGSAYDAPLERGAKHIWKEGQDLNAHLFPQAFWQVDHHDAFLKIDAVNNFFRGGNKDLFISPPHHVHIIVRG